MNRITSFAVVFGCAALTMAPSSIAAQGGLVDLGTLGGTTARALGVSDDGAVVVGLAARASGEFAAFRWATATGMQELGVSAPPGNLGALGVSGDGRFVFGIAFVGSRRDAFRWSASTGFERLGSVGTNLGLPATATVPLAISADGAALAGWSLSPQGNYRSFRWTQATGLVDLGTLGGSFAETSGISADGTAVIGYSYDASSRARAFRWTASMGSIDLGTLGGSHSFAYGVNADGSVVVGTARTATNELHAFRWTAAGGMQDLGTLGGAESSAISVSADGSVVAGNAEFGPSSAVRAFRWTAAFGMQDLGTLGGQQSHVSALSADGTVVVGTSPGPVGAAPRGFRWTTAAGMHELGTFGGAHSTPYGVSADGTVVVGSSTTASAMPVTRAFRWELGVVAEIGERYCASGAPNSSGALGRLEAHGSNALTANDVELVALALPLQSLGYFLTSMTQDQVPTAGGGQGTLCLGGAIGRFVGPGQVLNTGAAGSFALALDVAAFPQPFGAVAVVSGESWNFQAWHRDANPTSTSNFTDAVSVTFR